MESSSFRSSGPPCDNYFRVGCTPFFFRDQDQDSIAVAFEEARIEQVQRSTESRGYPPIAVWRTPAIRGPWHEYRMVFLVGESRETYGSSFERPFSARHAEPS